MNKLILILSILLLSALAQSADAQTQVENNSLHDFTSDGCSLSPDSISETANFVPCCVQHDIAYWAGGTDAEKLTADKNLKTCIAEKSKSTAIAEIYFLGVRIAGGPSLPTSFYWGYGWEKRREYAPLSEDQKQMAHEKLARVNWIQIYTSLGIELVK